MTVSVISPTTLTDAMLVSTTVPEAVVCAYAANTLNGQQGAPLLVQVVTP